MIDTTLWEIIWVTFTAIIGMISIGAGMIGYWYRKVNWLERILAVGAGLLLIYPESMSDIIGLVLFGVLFVIQLYTREKEDTKIIAV